MEVFHSFLVKAGDMDSAWNKIKAFLEDYQLIHYHEVNLLADISKSSEDHDFPAAVSAAVENNRKFLQDSVDFLKAEGYLTLDDIKKLPQGYLSKELHQIVHFLDGFFGIDSRFYNLAEHSHWISAWLGRKIERGTSGFWLLEIKALTGAEPFSTDELRDIRVKD